MKLSALEEYGLRCLVQVARHPRGEPCRVQDISSAEGLSPEYTAKLMRVLRQGELVVSVRGACGGYLLARPPAEISAWEALVVLDGPLFTDEFCVSHSGNRQDCVHQSGCGVRAMWRELGDLIEVVLKNISLADLARGEHGVVSRLMPVPTETEREVSNLSPGCGGCASANRSESPTTATACRDEEVR
jgi:Rrf2 family protein